MNQGESAPLFVCGLLLGLGCVVSAQKGFRRYKEKGEDTVTLERQGSLEKERDDEGSLLHTYSSPCVLMCGGKRLIGNYDFCCKRTYRYICT